MARRRRAAADHRARIADVPFSADGTASVGPDGSVLAALGRAALSNAAPGKVSVGRCGAGRATSVGKIDFSRAEFAGQGAAFGTFGDAKVLVVTVVNAIGVVVDRDGTIVRGNYHLDTGERRPPALDYERRMIPVHVSREATPAERGLALGATWRPDIERTYQSYAMLFTAHGLGPSRVRELGERALAETRAWTPEIAEEAAGTAAGAGLAPWQLGVLNGRTEILAAASATGEGECSTSVCLEGDTLGRAGRALQRAAAQQ